MIIEIKASKHTSPDEVMLRRACNIRGVGYGPEAQKLRARKRNCSMACLHVGGHTMRAYARPNLFALSLASPTLSRVAPPQHRQGRVRKTQLRSSGNSSQRLPHRAYPHGFLKDLGIVGFLHKTCTIRLQMLEDQEVLSVLVFLCGCSYWQHATLRSTF